MKSGLRKTLFRFAAALMMVLIGLPLLLTLAYRFVDPPLTPLMVIRLVQGHGIAKEWRGLSAISPHLRRSVIAAEDARFCFHHGFDWRAIDHAIDSYEEGGRVLGASTISMQTAKNLFLWPGRSFLRKGFEALFTFYLESLWPKRRILEVYLNVIEFGPGIYGAEAAARHFFAKSAAHLTQREAAMLAVILPDPLRRSPTRPSAFVARHAVLIDRLADFVRLGPEGGC